MRGVVLIFDDSTEQAKFLETLPSGPVRGTVKGVAASKAEKLLSKRERKAATKRRNLRKAEAKRAAKLEKAQAKLADKRAEALASAHDENPSPLPEHSEARFAN